MKMNASNATYASVLSQGSHQQHHQQHQNMLHKQMSKDGSDADLRDPFAALRDLGKKSNGYYNYFQ